MSPQQALVAAFLSLAVATRSCLSNPLPVPTGNADSSCAGGTTNSKPTSLNCPNQPPSTTRAEGNAVLGQLFCDVLTLRMNALSVCMDLSNCSVSSHV